MSKRKDAHSGQDASWCPINYYPWGGDYRPRAMGRIQFLPETGFSVKMRCFEKYRRKKHKKPNSPVYEDSCMECFVNFYPEEFKQYLNFEVNAGGIMLSQWGTGKADRTCIKDLGVEPPQVKLTETSEFWEIQYVIPFTLIKSLYGKSAFYKGDVIKCNFYKCGDLTPQPHFGCSAPIKWDLPNFHLPQFFADIIL